MTDAKSIHLIGAPVDVGGTRPGCIMGPDAMRVAGLAQSLTDLGHTVHDHGSVVPGSMDFPAHENPAIHDQFECAAWVEALQNAAYAATANGQVPVFIGGDHMMAAGTVAGVAARAAEDGAEQFVLWLDAHTDFHALDTTTSGNLHGTPVTYFSGGSGFSPYFPKPLATVKPEHISMLGIRSVDSAERARISDTGIEVNDMRVIDEQGIAGLLRAFLKRVSDAKGRLHVSLDVDFLDPDIAPAVGTTVPGGATLREAHLVMEMLHDSNLVTSMDIAELNPFLDVKGKTAFLMRDLIASLFGKTVLDRPTRSF